MISKIIQNQEQKNEDDLVFRQNELEERYFEQSGMTFTVKGRSHCSPLTSD